MTATRTTMTRTAMAARVLRGGAFYLDRGSVRCAFRIRNDPDYSDRDIGFRVVVASPG